MAIGVIVLGSLWHFIFDWSGQNDIIAAIAPVNESVWEHLKMGYWALIIYAATGVLVFNPKILVNFFSLLMGILLLNGAVLVIYYSYASLLHHSILWLDVTAYCAGALACQVSMPYLMKKTISMRLEIISAVALISLGLLFAIFTFYPPHAPMFMDSRTETYGILD